MQLNDRGEKIERLTREIVDFVKGYVKKEGGYDMALIRGAMRNADAALHQMKINFSDS